MQLQNTILNTLKFINKPTHIQISKSLGNLSISIRQNPQQLYETYNYMKQYSHYNFDSKYKNWFELNKFEQSKFMDTYINKHELINQNKQASNAIKQMDNENKDVNFMFFYLYEHLKQQADQVDTQEVVFKDDVYDLLIEKGDY